MVKRSKIIKIVTLLLVVLCIVFFLATFFNPFPYSPLCTIFTGIAAGIVGGQIKKTNVNMDMDKYINEYYVEEIMRNYKPLESDIIKKYEAFLDEYSQNDGGQKKHVSLCRLYHNFDCRINASIYEIDVYKRQGKIQQACGIYLSI